MAFDQYFQKSLKEGTRSGRGEGSQYLFEGDSTEIFYKMAESFLKNNHIYLSLKLLKRYQGDQIMIVTYRNTSLSSPSSCTELDIQVSVHPCEAEEADQSLVRHIELD